jgi:hypothetical protein
MNFPQFWARGRSGSFSVWRWSDASVDEVKVAAQAAAERMAAQFAADGLSNAYGYGNRPMREPVLREMRDASGELAWAVTRNSYGSHVLNSAIALFVDVDFPEQKPKGAGLFGSLFGKKPAEAEDPAKAPMAKAAAWAEGHPGWNWRIYRTKAGVRLLATHALFHPDDPVCEQVFTAMGADPLYRKLCQTQKCFRARLTPKPWRCGIGHPPARWPFQDHGEEHAFANWDAKYQAASRAKATCQLLDKGSGVVHDELREMVALHDEATRAGTVGFALA